VLEGDESFFLNVSVLDGAEAAVARDRAAATIQNQQVLSLGFSGSQRAAYTDLDGSRVVISLKGPGGGQVLLLGDARREAVGLTLTGTTAASALSVKGDTSLGDVTVAGPLGALAGKALDLLGNVTAGGALGKVQVRSMADGRLLSAAAIGTLSARGNFGGDVAVGSLGKMTVAGTLLDADVRSTGPIGSVRAGAARGSRVFAGVRAEVVDLPATLDDFANPAATIGAFAVNARAPGAFSDTLVAAPSIGRVVLGAVSPANNARPFGLAADTIKTLTAGPLRLANLTSPDQSRADEDLLVRVL
jgi:hypothetical protein